MVPGTDGKAGIVSSRGPVPHCANMGVMDAARVLVIDDDDSFRLGLRTALQSAGHQTQDFPAARPALHALAAFAPDIVLVDLRLPDLDGLAVLEHLRAADAELPVVLISGLADIETAVRAMQQGAYDFIEKPFSRERLLALVQRALQQRQVAQENRRLRAGLAAGAGLAAVLCGDSAPIRALRETVLRIAAVPVEVLLIGETGTGKELVARALHDFSGRHGPFVALNCAAVPEALFESELFGHEPGAFTGAARAREGRIEHADGGTLFLDEVESLPLAQQAKLLRVLQEREVTRLGANTARAVDLRVVAAAHGELLPGERSGFRADLYWRLATVVLKLPPLRERLEDLPLLFEHFRRGAALRFGIDPTPLPAALAQRLLAHDWPGNVRELKAAAERQTLGLPVLGNVAGAAGRSLQASLDAVEAMLIDDALRRHAGRVEAAAAELALSAATLYRKIKQHGLRQEDPGAAG